MTLLSGITYNLKGLWLGIKTPKLLMLGLVRFLVVIILTIISSSLLLFYHNEILNIIWTRPENPWILWLWSILSWVFALLLLGLSAILSYLISQILFGVIIMDYMSQITERMVTSQEKIPEKITILKRFFHLVKQEIPRTTLPVLLSLMLMVLGWFTPLGPLMAIITSGISVIFIAWDNTDLIPARQLDPFKKRFKRLLKTLPFHLGFGLLFLLPGLNILFLSFAPVGATLYYTDSEAGQSLEKTVY